MKETKVVLKGIILREGRILTVRRSFQDKIGAGSWEVVGGKLEFGESVLETLSREVKEETNLEINIERPLYAKNVVIDEELQMLVVVYLCKYKKGEVMLSEEHIAYRWVDEEGLKNLLSPEIKKDFEDNNVFNILMKERLKML
ncbi:NUDIX domain-containing protein [uncultured Clostridium sp.]|uniref:NUDIX hydrolase n=1 Tax=uncultured Clostridium sp. TaxID=59620 RepID=UPI00261DA403|nr:NUDIX domain-containing protein [uncultured Clostridium sp.]